MQKLLRLFPLALACIVVTHAQTAHPADGTSVTGRPVWLAPLQDLDGRLPSWLRLSGEYRARAENSGHIRYTDVYDSYLLSRLRLKIEIRPKTWFSFVAESTDARVFFNDHVASTPPNQNTWDFWQAYAELGNEKEGWFDVKVGRQIFAFGDERVIGPSNWLNQGRTFDAVRVDLHHPGYQVSLFASSALVSRDGVIDHHIQGNNLHGIYGSFKNLLPQTTIEPYVLWRVSPGNVSLSEDPGLGPLNETILGIRWVGNLPKGFDYATEMNREFGSIGPDSIHAWAGYWNAGRTFRNAWGHPRPFVEGNYASGTRNPNSRIWGTFDQVYPSAHDKIDFADQVGRRNVEQFRIGVGEKFGKKWTLKQTFEGIWLASARDALYASSGAPVLRSPNGTAGRHIGEEFDVINVFQLNSEVQIGFGYAHLFTGEFLKKTSRGRDYNYPYLYVEYKF
jgi:Alginate export